MFEIKIVVVVVVVVVVIMCLIIRGCDLTYAFCIYNSSTRANERQICLKLKECLIVAFETQFGHINFGALPENP